MIPYFSRILICLGVFLLLLYNGAARAQPETPVSGFLSLSEALQIALIHNPLINEVQAQADISTEHIVQAKSGFMPKIDAGAVRFRPMMLTAVVVGFGYIFRSHISGVYHIADGPRGSFSAVLTDDGADSLFPGYTLGGGSP